MSDEASSVAIDLDVPPAATPERIVARSRALPRVSRRVWEPALRRAKVRRVVLHSLRHTFASQLIALGEDVKYVQTQLGHASATLTLDTYGHLWPRESRRTAARFEALLADARVKNPVSTE